jgi:hypothetical protein
MQLMKRGQSYRRQDFFVRRFISGLKDNDEGWPRQCPWMKDLGSREEGTR